MWWAVGHGLSCAQLSLDSCGAPVLPAPAPSCTASGPVLRHCKVQGLCSEAPVGNEDVKKKNLSLEHPVVMLCLTLQQLHAAFPSPLCVQPLYATHCGPPHKPIRRTSAPGVPRKGLSSISQFCANVMDVTNKNNSGHGVLNSTALSSVFLLLP